LVVTPSIIPHFNMCNISSTLAVSRKISILYEIWNY
jgi:hypothetical protein